MSTYSDPLIEKALKGKEAFAEWYPKALAEARKASEEPDFTQTYEPGPPVLYRRGRNKAHLVAPQLGLTLHRGRLSERLFTSRIRGCSGDFGFDEENILSELPADKHLCKECFPVAPSREDPWALLGAAASADAWKVALDMLQAHGAEPPRIGWILVHQNGNYYGDDRSWTASKDLAAARVFGSKEEAKQKRAKGATAVPILLAKL